MGSKETREKTKAAFQMRGDDDTVQRGDGGGGERWLDSRHILTVEQSGLGD